MNHSVKIHGGATFDWMFASSNSSELPDGETITAEPEWSGDTFMLANFDDNISASEYGSSVDSIVKHRIYKRSSYDSKMKLVAEVASGEEAVRDYAIRSGESIEYIIYPISETNGVQSFMAPVVINAGKIEFGTFALIDLKRYDDVSFMPGDYVWNFYANVSASEYKHNISATVQNVNSKYPNVRRGLQNYVSGSITAYAGRVTDRGEYTEDQSVFDKWSDFLDSNNPKLLTDPFGHKYIVEVTSSSHKVEDYNTPPTSITFEFTEIDNADAYSVFDEVRTYGIYRK